MNGLVLSSFRTWVFWSGFVWFLWWCDFRWSDADAFSPWRSGTRPSQEEEQLPRLEAIRWNSLSRFSRSGFPARETWRWFRFLEDRLPPELICWRSGESWSRGTRCCTSECRTSPDRTPLPTRRWKIELCVSSQKSSVQRKVFWLFILKVSLLWWVHFSHRILKASRKKKLFHLKLKQLLCLTCFNSLGKKQCNTPNTIFG